MKLDTVAKQSIAMFISTLVLFVTVGGFVQIANQRSLDHFEDSMSTRFESLRNQVAFLQKQLECK